MARRRQDARSSEGASRYRRVQAALHDTGDSAGVLGEDLRDNISANRVSAVNRQRVAGYE
ncbi:MAG: hypothetical protein JWO49_1446 [Arthrobacter sp.]|nr:hypothetical protein [Arthrobacter sp.]